MSCICISPIHNLSNSHFSKSQANQLIQNRNNNETQTIYIYIYIYTRACTCTYIYNTCMYMYMFHHFAIPNQPISISQQTTIESKHNDQPTITKHIHIYTCIYIHECIYIPRVYIYTFLPFPFYHNQFPIIHFTFMLESIKLQLTKLITN